MIILYTEFFFFENAKKKKFEKIKKKLKVKKIRNPILLHVYFSWRNFILSWVTKAS